MDIRIKRFDKNLPLPAPEKNAACFDLICRETVTIPPHTMKAVPQNVALQVPDGHALLLFSRSSTPLRKGLMLANGVGVVDPFYCGDDDENLAFFLNVTNKPVTVEAGDKVVQGMIIKVETVRWQEVDAMNDEGHGGYQHSDQLEQAE
jgi:dUTP diphosphatase